MKVFVRLSLISTALFTHSVFALNPIPGLYGGLTAAVSHGPNNYTRIFSAPVPTTNYILSFEGTINYNFAGGGGGAVLGYRIGDVRIEAEGFYNYIGTSTMTIGTCTLESPTVETPTGICPQCFYDAKLGFNGSSGAFFGMANAYYDFYINEQEENPIVPYVGLGLGIADIKNGVNFVDTALSESLAGGTVSAKAGAAQLIVGLSYFLDDYAWIGMDFRYLSTGKLNLPVTFHADVFNFLGNNTSRYTVEAINFNINASFDNSAKDY